MSEKRAYEHFRANKKEKQNPHLFYLLVVPLKNHVLHILRLDALGDELNQWVVSQIICPNFSLVSSDLSQ